MMDYKSFELIMCEIALTIRLQGQGQGQGHKCNKHASTVELTCMDEHPGVLRRTMSIGRISELNALTVSLGIYPMQCNLLRPIFFF